MKGKKLGDFYKEFFNHNFFRDIDYIRGEWWKPKPDKNGDHVQQWTDRVRYKVQKNTGDLKSIESFKKKARYFLVNKNYRDGNGQLVHHNSYFRNVPDFHSLNTKDRLYDRLFFDIDKHDDTIDGFKHEIADIKAKQIGSDNGYTYKQKLKDIKDVQGQYREYIFNNDFLAEPFNDAVKVLNFYRDRGTEPVLISTSGAGFHINVFFNPVHLNNPSDVFLSYTNMIADKTGVTSLDDAPPKNAVIGTQRTPYSVHEKSGLYGFIIPPDTSYDDYMALLEKNRPTILNDFSYENHLTPDLLREQILKMDKTAGNKKELKKKHYKQKQSKSKGYINNVYLDGKYVGTAEHDPTLNISDDLRILWDLMVDDGMAAPVQDKDIREHYNRVRCPFPDHEDRNPSAICGQYRFKCFKCCPDGINWYMLIAVTYGIVDIKDVKKDVTPEQKEKIRKIIRKLTSKSSD